MEGGYNMTNPEITTMGIGCWGCLGCATCGLGVALLSGLSGANVI